MWDLMNTGADLRQYVLQTHNSKIMKIQWGGGLNSRNPRLGTSVDSFTYTSWPSFSTGTAVYDLRSRHEVFSCLSSSSSPTTTRHP